MPISEKQRDHLTGLHAKLRAQAAEDLAKSDRQILAWREQGLTYARIASRLGVNRARAHQRVQAALRRQKERDGR